MDNYIQPGKTLTFTAPYALASGAGFLVGSLFAVATRAAAQGDPVEGDRFGVYSLAKTSAQAWAFGDKIYWDNTNKRCDTDSTVGMLIGSATAAAADPSSTGSVVLNGTAPDTSEGPQAAIADIATANASDLTTAQALANANKATTNLILAALRNAGIIDAA